MATGIKDKVAIIGMGCTRFGERWDVGAEELMVEAFQECLADAGLEKKDIEAAWFGSCLDEINVGKSALPKSEWHIACVLKDKHTAAREGKLGCTRVG